MPTTTRRSSRRSACHGRPLDAAALLAGGREGRGRRTRCGRADGTARAGAGVCTRCRVRRGQAVAAAPCRGRRARRGSRTAASWCSWAPVPIGRRRTPCIAGLAASSRGAVVDLTGRTSLLALAGVLGLAARVLANDSGAMHLAAALGTPTVSVFGPDAGVGDRAARPAPHPDARGVVPSLHAARVPARPPLHDRRHAGPRHRRPARRCTA